MTAPERIKAWFWNGRVDSGQWAVNAVGPAREYILATPKTLAASPEVQAMIAKARREGWNVGVEAAAALAHPPQWERKGKPGLWRLRRAKIAAAIRALREETP